VTTLGGEPGRTVAIALGPHAHDTTIKIAGVAQRNVERFVMQQRAGDQRARLELVRIDVEGDVDERSGELPRFVETIEDGADITIAGLADVVELLQREGTRAANEGGLVLTSFMINERSDPGAIALADLVRDAKRYRALRLMLERHEGTTLVVENLHGAEVDTATAVDQLDAMTDGLRAQMARERAESGDTSTGTMPS
jgi:hypothetical protein